MKRRHLLSALWLLTAGCSGSTGGASIGASGGLGNYSTGGAQSFGGNAGSLPAAADASAPGRDSVDARAREVLPTNLSDDAPTFNWLVPEGGAGGGFPATGGMSESASGGSVATGGVASSGGARSTGGVASSGGARSTGGVASSGGAMPTGGAGVSPGGGSVAASGGSPASGGFMSTGGAATGRGGSAMGGSTSGYSGTGGANATGGFPSSGGLISSGGRTSGGSGGGTGATYDAGVIMVDARPSASDASSEGGALSPDASPGGPDALSPPDAGSVLPCSARIRALVPVSLDHLVAGANSQVVLRAEVVSGGPASVSGWTWQAWFGTSPLSPAALGKADPSVAAFKIAYQGSYTFSVTDGSGACSASLRANPFAANACPICDQSAIVRAAPPPSANIPVQTGSYTLSGSSPFAQNNIILGRGVSVSVAPSVGTNIVVSYVRILDKNGTVVADGLADQLSSFTSRLLTINKEGDLLSYNVLAVPINPDGDTIDATAPQLFPQLTPAAINATTFSLTDGIPVGGKVTASDGTAINDVRVVLSNRDPKDTKASSTLLFSSVGDSGSDGVYQLQVQGGSYWATATPPAGNGLAEAVSASSLSVSPGTNLDMQWDAPTAVALTLNVADAQGSPLGTATVTLSTAQARKVGRFTLRPSNAPAMSVDAYGSVRLEGTTSSAGVVTFDQLPSNTTYQLLIRPGHAGPFAMTTTTTVVVPSTATTANVAARAAAQINGTLIPAPTTVAFDLSRVTITAYDKSDNTPDPVQVAAADSGGNFSLSVAPDRPYVLLVTPPIDSPFARTFVGSGSLTATEIPLSQTLPLSMDWRALVIDGTQNGVGSAALQVFCHPSWPTCVDSTIPLAETTSDGEGTFRLPLPDPTTR